MTKSRGKKEALELLRGPRGHFIVSRAFFVALQTLMRKPEEEWETSELGDMMLIAIYLFPEYFYSDAVRQEETNAEAA